MTTATATKAPKTAQATQAQVPALQHRSLIQKFAAKYSIDADKLMGILKATAFKVSQGEVSNEQMAALLVVADQYGLNPFTREIFAFEDKYKGIVPVVSVDGWARIINEHDQFDGVEWAEPDEIGKAPEGGREALDWMECIIYRKDRSHPTKVREYFDEVYQQPRGQNKTHGPWQTHPKRMLRHKSLIQCARIAFGFAGIFDEDEAARIIEAETLPPAPIVERGASGLKKALTTKDAAPQPSTAEFPAASSQEGAGQGDAAAAAATKSKASGTVELRDKIVKQFGDCKDAEILDLVADEARDFEWTPPDQAVIDAAYTKRRDELAK